MLQPSDVDGTKQGILGVYTNRLGPCGVTAACPLQAKCQCRSDWTPNRSCPSAATKMAEKSCTIRTRKFMTNKLLQRRQFVSSCQHS